jgi:hypothetical protein
MRYVNRNILLREDQIKWIRENTISLSPFVRKLIDIEIDKRKKGVNCEDKEEVSISKNAKA